MSNEKKGIGQVMGKIIIAREDDKGKTPLIRMMLLTTLLMGGLAGLPIGAILSGAMQDALNSTSIPVRYGFLLLPVIIGSCMAFWVVKKNVDTKDHTRCSNCGNKMKPTTETDSLYWIPAGREESYENPLYYLAGNMKPILSVRDIPHGKRGCYVCCYACVACSKRIVRVADFAPEPGRCRWKESYYFDYQEFASAAETNDLHLL